MQIDPQTLLFTDLTVTEAHELIALVEQINETGIVPGDLYYVQLYEQAANPPPGTRLLHLSMVFPLKALLSAVKTLIAAKELPALQVFGATYGYQGAFGYTRDANAVAVGPNREAALKDLLAAYPGTIISNWTLDAMDTTQPGVLHLSDSNPD